MKIMLFGELLTKLRKVYKITMREISGKAKVSTPFLKMIETGQRNIPSDEKISEIAKSFQGIVHGKYNIYRNDYYSLLKQASSFELSLSKQTEFIWFVLRSIFFESYRDFDETGKAILSSFNLVALRHPIDSKILDNSCKDNHIASSYYYLVLNLFDDLSKRPINDQLKMLSHYVDNTLLNFKTHEIDIQFSNPWLKEKYAQFQQYFRPNLIIQRLAKENVKLDDEETKDKEKRLDELMNMFNPTQLKEGDDLD